MGERDVEEFHRCPDCGGDNVAHGVNIYGEVWVRCRDCGESAGGTKYGTGG